MKIKSSLGMGAIAILAASVWLQSCSKPTAETADTTPVADLAPPQNNLTQQEQEAGWELLFNGKDLDGWKRYNHDTIGPLWSVRDSSIVVDGTGLGEGSGKHGGSLMTIKQFGNFELTVDWKISAPGGNSGIIYHVVEKPEYKTDYATGPEAQIIDDAGWTGGPLTAAQKVGSNYDMFPADSTKKVVNPVGDWNTTRVVYLNGHVEHWLNGEKVVEFEEGSPAYQAAYKKSKWVDYPGWNKFKVGSISLQDHGAPVYFRNIKVRAL
ncbi:MAG TPA: DUF1080 domain-containing protein [Cyclobacteriaceae bacterium]|nr:DUF1080 domain-containing protein [Cyclobacteriaceae bacterium]